MKQGWMYLPLCAALLMLGAGAALPAYAARAKAPAAAATAKAKQTTRQFTGYVTASDKTSLTVEKRGKQPKTMVFSKHAEMKSTGDIEKEARVTVYYREEGGHAVALRVVVKPQSSAANER